MNQNLQNSSFLRSVLIGTLLGDSSLQTYTQGKTWRTRFIQDDLQKSYLFHLYDLFQDYVATPPKAIISNGNTKWYFNTIVHPDLNPYAQLFYQPSSLNYKNNKFLKIMPYDFTPDFNDISLAYWYMDDGSLKSNKKAYILCTDNFSLIELQRIRVILKDRFNIWVSFHKQGKKYSIYIPVKHYEEVKNKIEKYVVVDLRYKL